MNTNAQKAIEIKRMDTNLIFQRLQQLTEKDQAFVGGFILGLSSKNANIPQVWPMYNTYHRRHGRLKQLAAHNTSTEDIMREVWAKEQRLKQADAEL